jgi:H2-forming N5,N10-methylenetetrahydromethanopterin dehydrogenase-like enzyme
MSLDKDIKKTWKDTGIKFPFAFDAATKQPSVTLLFAWIANALAIASLIYLHITSNSLFATTATISYAVIMTILYLMRKLQHAKFDLKNESFDLTGDDNEHKKDS